MGEKGGRGRATSIREEKSWSGCTAHNAAFLSSIPPPLDDLQVVSTERGTLPGHLDFCYLAQFQCNLHQIKCKATLFTLCEDQHCCEDSKMPAYGDADFRPDLASTQIAADG